MSIKLYPLSNRGLSPLNPLNVGYEYCSPAHAFGPAVRRYYLIHYIVSGYGRFQTRGQTYSLGPGACFIIRPNEVTRYAADKEAPWHYIWIGFTASFPLPPCIIKEDVLEADVAADCFLQLKEQYAKYSGNAGENGLREAFICGKILEILLLFGQKYAQKKETQAQKTARIAQNYIDLEFASGITVAELASRLHHERTYLSRIFKAAVGMSPQKYLCQKRLSEAEKLLTECSMSPTDAACAVGYPDIYAFSKAFKRQYGLSPRAYRAAAEQRKSK